MRNSSLQERLIEAFAADILQHNVKSNPGSRVKLAIDLQLEAFSKKFLASDADNDASEAAAELLFREVNDRCKTWNDSDRVREKHESNAVLNCVLNSARAALEPLRAMGPPSLLELRASLTPGPGAAAYSAKECTDQSWFAKFYQNTRTSSHPGVYRLVSSILRTDRLWASAEDARIAYCHSIDRPVANTALNSQYFTVPKNAQIRRSCATEPNDNMMCQKATGDKLVAILAVFGIIIQRQQFVNRELARISSIGKTPDGYGYATLDLKSASDTILFFIVRFLFGNEWFSWLNTIRSTHIDMPNGESLELSMFSTMGNGFTFPLQTLIFMALILGVYDFLGIERTNDSLLASTGSANNFGIYGDDIIVDCRAYDLLTVILSQCGFIVNLDKSFTEPSRFRESCGADYYLGYNVRPVFVTSLDSDEDLYSTINRLNQWGFFHSIKLHNTISVLLSAIERSKRFPVPGWMGVDSGIYVPESLLFDTSLFAPSVRCGSHISVARTFGPGTHDGFSFEHSIAVSDSRKKIMIKASSDRVDTEHGLLEWPCFKDLIALFMQKVLKNNKPRKWTVFSEAHLFAIMAKQLGPDGRVGIRSLVPRFTKSRSYTPSWSAVSADDPIWGFSADAVSCNLAGSLRSLKRLSDNFDSYLHAVFSK